MTPNNSTGEASLIAASFLFLLGAVVGNCGGSIARSQAPREASEELLLARLCVSESGIRSFVYDDCAAIHAVISFRAERLYRSTYRAALHRYSRSATVRREGRRRRWIAHLWGDARMPRYWRTTSARWEGRNDAHWLRTLRHARRIFRGEVTAPCSPHTWGAPYIRPADASAQIVDCGNTRNTFWSVPAYARAFDS